jgi:siderophore synthetase component
MFTDVFDCIFRFLSALLEEDDLVTQEQFWETAAQAIRDYQLQHPELADQFSRHDLRRGFRILLPEPPPAAQQSADA